MIGKKMRDLMNEQIKNELESAYIYLSMAAYFHAQWRREKLTQPQKDYVLLDGVTGRGHYVGTYLAWTALQSDWWGEGEVKFYLDGDKDQPTMADNGTEDYFGGSFGFSPINSDECWNNEQPFSYPYLGMPLARLDAAAHA